MSHACSASASIVFAIVASIALRFEAAPAFAGEPAPVSRPADTEKMDTQSSKVDAEMGLEEFGIRQDTTCASWTDGCRACGRDPEGISCSNIGIACQVKEPHCTRIRPWPARRSHIAA
jgi:hypothetical protein